MSIQNFVGNRVDLVLKIFPVVIFVDLIYSSDIGLILFGDFLSNKMDSDCNMDSN